MNLSLSEYISANYVVALFVEETQSYKVILNFWETDPNGEYFRDSYTRNATVEDFRSFKQLRVPNDERTIERWEDDEI
ncbi:hypothetical protein [Brevibacillus brevis]|uniref:hypothetical protein n=1 Tax=Brevibacillus brevis TaxID=1393 RepID=UPI000D0F7CBA|nr:hypothetical protein [Brevibacillus brevis]PSJ67469.1 hypothetical protein C7J99_20980 [Brevibacillus brevis]RED28458.1 hypothetical protein DES34_108325 [Brevibacillus brevis]GEC90712.1 hypothetical protein BBR01nite_30430 [Brevibacillus brevis]VEF91153.1 Uncharacterised protein [Brevibacillus brevis]